MTVKPIEAVVLIFLAMMSLAISARAADQITNFKVEWCSVNRFRQMSDVDQVCFGRATFLGEANVRAIGFRLIDGRNEVYLENSIPKVELLELDIKIVGPVNGTSMSAEFGHVFLSIDDDGEINAVQGTSPRHGRFGSFRDSRDRMP